MNKVYTCLSLYQLLAAAMLLLPLSAARAQPSTPSGNVGIGTTTPTQKLDVNGNLRIRGLSGAGGGLPQLQPDGTLNLYSPPAYSPASDPYTQQPVLLNPNPRGGTTGGTNVAINSYGPYSYDPNDIAVNGTLACLVNANANTLQVFDISTPTNPVLKGTVSTGDSPYSVAVSGTLAYVAASGANTLQVFDISTPTNPVLKGTVSTDSYPISVAVSGTLACVAASGANTLQVFDISTPTPVLKGTVSTDSYLSSVAVSGTLACVVASGANTLQVFDISTPTNPVLKGTVSTSTYPITVEMSGTLAYVANDYTNAPTLQVFDVSTPASPVLKSTVNTAGPSDGIALGGTIAYLLAGDALQVFQVGGGVRALGLQADGSLGLASAALLTLSGQNLGIVGGNTVTLPGDNLGNHTATQNLNLATYQLVGQGGSHGLSISSSGSVGLGTSSPYSLLANTASNVLGSDNFGVSAPSLTWTSDQQGYTAALYNSNASGAGGGGLAVKVASRGGGTAALDVSQAASATMAGTTLLRVRANGNVGIGTGSPAAVLDVNGSTRLRGLTTAGVVTTDASGNLGSAAASSLGDNLGNHTATQQLVLASQGVKFADGTTQATAAVGDNLGNHTATQNLNLATYQLVGQGGSQGLSISSSGSVGIGVASPAARLDVAGNAQVSGKLLTPATGGANLLAAGYGNVYGTGRLYNGSNNVSVTHTANTGEYTLTFTGPLATADLSSVAVSLTLFNGPGFVSFTSPGSAGQLLVRTYNPAGTLTDRGFAFVVFQP